MNFLKSTPVIATLVASLAASTSSADTITLTKGDLIITGEFVGITPHPAYIVRSNDTDLYVPMKNTTCEGADCVVVDQ